MLVAHRTNRLLVLRLLQKVERGWHSYIVLALTSLRHYILLANQLLLELSHQTVLFVFNIYIDPVALTLFKDLGFALEGWPKLELLALAKLTSLTKVDQELFPRNPVSSVLLVNSEEQRVERLSLTINGFATLNLQLRLKVVVLYNRCKEFFL